MRQYLIIFDPNHYVIDDSDGNEKIVPILFFNSDNGYDHHDLDAVEALEIGDTIALDAGAQTVMRVDNEWNQYQDYVKDGDPFFTEGLEFQAWYTIKQRILKDMYRWGAD